MRRETTLCLLLAATFSLFFALAPACDRPPDPCAGVACDTPPGPCHETVGTCRPGGICYYEPKPVDTPCDDGDPCTQSDSCDGAGACVGRNPNTCNGNGTCNPDGGTCECNSTHTGPGCAACAPDCYDYPTCTYCHADTTCNGHGACNPDGTCACAGNWTGPDCKICPSGFCGTTCRPAHTITDVWVDCSAGGTGTDCLASGTGEPIPYPLYFSSSGVERWSALVERVDGGGTPGYVSPPSGTLPDGGTFTTQLTYGTGSDTYNLIRITVLEEMDDPDGGCQPAWGQTEITLQ